MSCDAAVSLQVTNLESAVNMENQSETTVADAELEQKIIKQVEVSS